MICGDRIKLRHVEESELGLVIKLLNDTALRGEFLSVKMTSPQQFKKEFGENGFSCPDKERLLMIDAEQKIIGVITHFTSTHYSSAREIGFQIFEAEARGKGYATEAVRLLIDYLFKVFPVNRLEMRMHSENKASEKVAVKCGFTKEGDLRQSLFVQGKYNNAYLYALLREECKV